MKNMPKAIIAAAICTALLGTAACSGGNGGGGTTPAGSGGNSALTCTTPKKTFKLAFNQTEQHPQYLAAVHYGELLKQGTGGCYDIKVYANETLGAQADVLNNISDGSVDMAYIGGPVMETMNADLGVFNLPYVFDNKAAQDAVFSDDSIVGDLKTSMEASKHITVLSLLYSGTRNVYAKKPIQSPADLTGQKVRVQQSDSQVKMLNLMGGIATPMAQGDVYSALQTGTLDGAENNETVYDSLKHDEVAKFYSYTQHLMIPDYLIMNTDTLKAMSEADQQTLLGLVPQITKEANDGFLTFVQQSIDAAKAKGATFVTDVDVAAFKANVAPLVAEYITNDVRQKLYDAVQASNAAHK